MNRFYSLVLCIALISLAGCATGPQSSKLDMEMSRTQDMLRTNRSESHAEYEALKTEIEGIQSRLDHLAKIQADLMVTLDEFKMNLQQVTQSLADVSHRLNNLKKVSSRPPATAANTSEPETGSDLEQSADHLYKTAYNDYLNRKFDLAVVEFQNFLTSFKDSDLADNAQYWIGECYYAQRKFEEAISEFEKVVIQYPDGEKAIGAILKQGLSYLELGNTAKAKEILNGLIEKYPYTKEARIAEDRLKDI